MTIAPIVRAPEDLEAFRISPDDTVKLAVLSAPSTGSDATVVFEIWEPAVAQPPNSHPCSAETFVVLAGTAVAESDEHAVSLRAGQTLVLAPGSVHRIVNSSSTRRLYALTIMANDGGFAELITRGTPAPLDAEDLAVLRGPAEITRPGEVLS
jgi:mannose-6-phosphate isomerase-like protein (cupin superfamily)